MKERFHILGSMQNRIIFALCLVQIACLVHCLKDGTRSSQDSKSDDYVDIFFPPLSKEEPFPTLLHERDIIHYVNSDKEYVQVGNGEFGNVYLGELRDTGALVVIKTFIDSSFTDIMMEVKMHRFVEQLGFTPRLIGLLPTGPASANLSLVYEYISHSRSLSDCTKGIGNPFTSVQWLSACRQLIYILQRLHENEVYFNDLHRGNVLIQQINDQIKVYIIDFGFATYRHGKIYNSGYGTLTYLAPELRSHVNRTTTAVDVYAFGNGLSEVAEKTGMSNLGLFAEWCKAFDPFDRPKVSQILTKLEGFLFEAKLIEYANYGPRKRKLPLQNHTFQPINQRRSFVEKFEESLEWEWLTTTGKVLSRKCPFPLSVLWEKDLNFEEGLRDPEEFFHKATLNFTNEVVFVKEFQFVEFEQITEKACVNSYLASKGVAQPIVGIFIEDGPLSESSIVFKKYGQAVTLAEFVLNTAGVEWDLRYLKQTLKRKNEVEFYDEVEEIIDSFTRYNPSDLFYDVLDDFIESSTTSLIKTYRQRYLETISSLITDHMKTVHLNGLLVNNLAPGSVILKLHKRMGVDARLVHLGETSSLSGVTIAMDDLDLELDSKYSYYVAPEIMSGHRTSTSSDVYSLCAVLYWMMEAYFTSYDSKMAYTRHNERIEVDARRNSSTINGPADSRIYSSGSGQGHCTRDKADVCNTKLLYGQYQNLLLKCLHSSPEHRPHIKDIDRIVKEILHSS